MNDALFDEQLHPTFAVDLPGPRQAALNADEWWAALCDRGIAELARRGVPFQSFDLVELGVPEPDDPNRWGARLSLAKKRGLIESIGAEPSKRSTVAGSLVRVWRGVRQVDAA